MIRATTVPDPAPLSSSTQVSRVHRWRSRWDGALLPHWGGNSPVFPGLSGYGDLEVALTLIPARHRPEVGAKPLYRVGNDFGLAPFRQPDLPRLPSMTSPKKSSFMLRLQAKMKQTPCQALARGVQHLPGEWRMRLLEITPEQAVDMVVSGILR